MKKLIRFLWSALIVRGRPAKFYYRASRGLKVHLDAPASPAFREVLDAHLKRISPRLWIGKVDAKSYLGIKGAAATDGFTLWVNGKRLKGGRQK